jgi:putative ABC transport system permease protein
VVRRQTLKLRHVAFQNLRRRKGRAAFLVVGLLIGIATVVTLLTLSAALRVQAQNNLEMYGANIILSPQTDGLALSYGGVTLGGVSLGQRSIAQADLGRIDTIPNRRNIAIVAPKLLGVTEVNGREAVVMGVIPKDEFRLKRWWKLDGRPPANGDEVVAGAAAAEALHLKSGDRVTIGGRRFAVSGVLRPLGSQDDNLLIIDLAAAQALFAKPGKVSMVEVAALCSNCPVGDIVDQLAEVLPGTKVVALQERVKNRLHVLDQLRSFGYIVAAVIVVIESLVVLVTMMGSVNARTREIGILRALGFRRGHVTGLILLEALAASLLAGVLGYLAGMGLSYAVLPLLASGEVGVTWAPALAGAAIGLAVLVGSLGSLYPALRASRLDPTVALRAL